jgi:hypothetical protein
VRRFGLALAPLAFLALSACTTLATSPSWVGGTLAESAPERTEREESAIKKRVAEILSEPKQIRAKHILVMHDDSERKPGNIKRTRADAKARAEEALAKIRAGADFDAMVEEYSDEPGAKERHGDLERFGRRTMVKAFEDAAFKLKVGEVSDIVETPFGFHIIKRTE